MSRFLSQFASGLIGRFENWRARERAFQELASLDDRSLADIGLNRGDIPFVLDRRSNERADNVAPVISAGTVRHAA